MSGFFSFYGESRNLESEEQGCLPAMTYKERVAGFGLCFGLSLVIDLLSFGSAIGLVTGSPTRFALSFTLSNILMIAATGFLVGFKRQWKSICDKKRVMASSLFIGAMLMTLVSALILRYQLLTLIFIVVEVCAFVWYIASYVPWGRQCLSSACRSCFSKCMDV